MGKRVKTTETIISDGPESTIEAVQEIPTVAPTQEEMEFTDYLESLGPATNQIKIHKFVEGVRKYCGRAEPATLKIEGEEYILKRWGGGRYYLMSFLNGRYVQDGSRVIEIYEPPEPTRIMNAQASDTSESRLLREEIQRQHEMVLRLLESQKAPAAQGPSLVDLVAALGSMKSLVPPAPGLDSILPGLVGLMKFAKEAVTSDSGSSGSFGTIVEGALKAIPLIMGGLSGMKANNGASAEVQGQEPVTLNSEQAEKKMLGQAISRLKDEANGGMDPDLVVAWISSHMEDPGYRNMAVILLNRQFESLFLVDADLEKEPLRTWFKKVYDELRKVMIDDNPSQEPTVDAGGVGS